jgi:hypothetical protein
MVPNGLDVLRFGPGPRCRLVIHLEARELTDASQPAAPLQVRLVVADPTEDTKPKGRCRVFARSTGDGAQLPAQK